jgi:hypothetical protein
VQVGAAWDCAGLPWVRAVLCDVRARAASARSAAALRGLQVRRAWRDGEAGARAGQELQLDWLELPETPWGEPSYVLVGALSFFGRVRAEICEGITFAHLVDALDGQRDAAARDVDRAGGAVSCERLARLHDDYLRRSLDGWAPTARVAPSAPPAHQQRVDRADVIGQRDLRAARA